MKLTVKTLSGEPFTVDDVDENQTTLQLKTKIEGLKQWAASDQKLIHAGKIMGDAEKISTYKVKEGSFLVCVVSQKKKPAPAPAAAPTPAPAQPSPAAPAQTPAAPATSTPSSATTSSTPSTSAPAPATPATTASSAPPTTAAPSPVAGPAFEASVSQLKDMGFPEEECRRALTAAFGNSARAVDYLMNGIPDNVAGIGAEAAPGAPAPGGATGAGQTAPSAGGIEALRSHPQFNQLRRAVQSNPQALGVMLQELGRADPGLLAQINANREQFVAMMNEPIEEEDTDTAMDTSTDGGALGGIGNLLAGDGAPNPQQFAQVLQAMQQMPPEQRSQLATAMGVPPEQLQAITQLMQSMPPEALAQMFAQGAAAGGAGGFPERNVVSLTEDEMAAVDRLCELGFPKQACVEAYLACDKNEELAANYLFNNQGD